jgi:hypothetical protein
MSEPPDQDDPLIEAAASAWRPRDPHGQILPHPAWADLDEEGREAAFALAQKLRAMEAALDPENLSSTARAVLERIKKNKP